VKLLSHALLDELAAKAAASPRARAHHNIHAAASEVVQRFVVVALSHSYFRPHRHTTKAELATVVRGRIDVLVFDGHGAVTARHAIGEGSDSIAYETPPNVWHTVVPGAGGGAFLEVKEGPYDPGSSPHGRLPRVMRAQPGSCAGCVVRSQAMWRPKARLSPEPARADSGRVRRRPQDSARSRKSRRRSPRAPPP
jgi:cupin fold WbuC family metalloprotein